MGPSQTGLFRRSGRRNFDALKSIFVVGGCCVVGKTENYVLVARNLPESESKEVLLTRTK